MSNENHSELKELLGALMGPEEAQKAAEDIRAADQILHGHPGPEPSREVLLRIKALTAGELARRRRVRVWRKYAAEVVAAAAVLVLLAGVGLKFFQTDTHSMKIKYISKAIWDTDRIQAEDPKLAYFNTEVDQLEQEFRTFLSTPEQPETSASELYEMEMEVVAMETDFWKG